MFLNPRTEQRKYLSAVCRTKNIFKFKAKLTTDLITLNYTIIIKYFAFLCARVSLDLNEFLNCTSYYKGISNVFAI